MIRIEIDGERCVGSGNCLYWAPKTFDLGDDGVAVVLDPIGDDEDRVRVAAEGCPTRAITVTTVEGSPDEKTEGGSHAHRSIR